MDQINLITVQAFATQIEADLAKSQLESAGIDATIQADRAGGMRDHLAWSGFGFKLLVREEDVKEAREALHPLHRVPEGKLVIAMWCKTLEEAEVAQGTLDSVGISVAIEPIKINERNSPLSLISAFRVLVAEKDADAAREVLNPPAETHA